MHQQLRIDVYWLRNVTQLQVEPSSRGSMRRQNPPYWTAASLYDQAFGSRRLDGHCTSNDSGHQHHIVHIHLSTLIF
jgi:hypothetical protein